MTHLHDLSAHELLAGYRIRAFSPAEVTQAVIAHIDRWEPRLRATYLYRPEAALEQARASEARWLLPSPSKKNAREVTCAGEGTEVEVRACASLFSSWRCGCRKKVSVMVW